jgi:hypothetical protein
LYVVGFRDDLRREYLGGQPVGRGRRKSITASAPPLVPGQKLPPPPELSPEQVAIWNEVIAPLPSGWINGGSEPLARVLCQHIAFSDGLCRDIELARAELTAALAEPATDAKEEKAKAVRCRKARAQVLSLSRAHLLQTGAIARLSQKLRLTKLSQYMRSSEGAAIAARSMPSGPEPWNDWRGGNGGGREQ